MKTKWSQIQLILGGNLTPWQRKVWLDPLSVELSDQEFFVFAPSSYMADFIKVKFGDLLAQTVRQVIGEQYVVQIAYRAGLSDKKVDMPDVSHAEKTSETALISMDDTTGGNGSDNKFPIPRPLSAVQMGLPLDAPVRDIENRWQHKFEDFVTGPSNELAYAASRSMCGEAYSPDVLFLSSAPGLGKTHLIKAVGRSLYEGCNRRTPRVEYLTSEEFASEFYLSLKSQQTDRFKARYRNLDLFLLEDVHFFQGKEKMQLELLSTIKALCTKGAKVVFTSSFLPRDLTQMDEQLQSRLSGGFVSAIERPDKETRRRIFKQKAALHQVILPDDVEDILAQHIMEDVRQIESCLQNLVLKARLFNSTITMQMAWDIICTYASHSPILDLPGIIDFVCKGFGVSKEQLTSCSRKQEYVSARNTAFFLARKHTDLSLEAIGQLFNRRHSTVLKGITNIEREMSRQTPLGKQIANTVGMIEKNGTQAQHFFQC